jgi:hypothetical protein
VPDTHATVFHDLNNDQANGLACVEATCRVSFSEVAVSQVPVGVAASTGSQVFACAGACARAVGYTAPAGEQLHIGADR